MARVFFLIPAVLLLFSSYVLAQDSSSPNALWSATARFELKANFRNSNEDRFRLRFPFPPNFLPPGATAGFEETVDAGSHAEVSLVSLNLDVGYAQWFAARARIDAIDLYDRNPTSGDRKIDADELWIRFGPKPEGLALPTGTSVFLQMGKAPKIERQPVRLLESYGLTSTSFNRFEDVMFLLGGSVGKNVYWRAQVSSGNPVFFRDSNALAGDNGIAELRLPFPDPELKSGFPILYDAEVEDYFFDTSHDEIGGGVGYRWRRDDESMGFDMLLFHYERELAETVELEGTFYGGDLDLLDGTRNISLPLNGNDKRESGARFYGEWRIVTLVAQYVQQTLSGLERDSFEIEGGIDLPLAIGPTIRSSRLVSSIQPAVRFSRLDNHFRGPREFPAPSVWWDWDKLDAGVRIRILDNYDLTLEHAFHDVASPVKLDVDETLVTLRIRI